MMTRKTKQELIAQIVTMLNAVIEVDNEQQITEQKKSVKQAEIITVMPTIMKSLQDSNISPTAMEYVCCLFITHASRGRRIILI